MDLRVYEIWLSLACTPDTATFARLLESFDNAKDIYDAGEKQIRSAVGLKSSDAARLNNKNLERAEQIYNFCTTKGVGILSYFDEDFPISLKDIPTPPVLLYYRGKLPNFDKDFRCAIVGTRSLSDYGRINAFRLGYDMGMAGATIVSGMAVGIDGVAMAGALAAGAKTIAVLGSGIDVCYPPEHLQLAKEIVKSGCVFTEYPPGTRPERFNFPRRNRIISGLSRVTVVVEGNEGSGSMITARHAKAQGRPVYAFPGNVGNEGSQATHLLIKNGALLCTSADDIVRDYCNEVGAVLNPFNLPVKRSVNMNRVLCDYKISAVTPSDDIFRPPMARKKVEATQAPATKDVTTEPKSVADDSVDVPNPLPVFDAELLRLYKKIPMDTDCSVEELVDDKTNLRSVMKMLLKLEMSRFVILLPGDRVKRNLR